MTVVDSPRSEVVVNVDDLAVARCEIDVDGHVLGVNNALVGLLGRERAELMGRDLRSLLVREEHIALVRTLASSPPFGAQPLVLRRPDGEEVEVWVVARKLAAGRVSLEAMLAPPSLVADSRADDVAGPLRDALVRVVEDLWRDASPEAVFGKFWAEASSILDATQGYLLECDDSGYLRPTSGFGVSRRVLESIAVPVGSHWAPARAHAEGQTVAIFDARECDELDPAVVQALRVRSTLFVPLRAERPSVLGFGWSTNVVSLGSHIALGGVLGALLATVMEHLSALARQQSSGAALEEALRLRDDVLSILHHELRTPLLTIRNVAARLQRTESLDPRDVHASSALITEEAGRLCRLVDNGLDARELEHGTLRCTKGPTNIARLVRSIVRELSSGVPDVLLAANAPGVAMAMADAERIRQVLLNLIGNAMRHAPPGTAVVVEVATTTTDVVVHVRDEGPGVAAADVERVFEKFERGPGGSSGLGLYIAREMIDRHGGRIWCEAGPPGTFGFSIPRSQ